MKRSIFRAGVIAALVAGCDGPTPADGPGTLTAALISPNGAEGAAVLDVTGAVESFDGSSEVSVYTTPSASGTRVILVRMTPGSLEMSLRVPDISRPPTIAVVEVAGGDDRIRSPLTEYRVEFR